MFQNMMKYTYVNNFKVNTTQGKKKKSICGSLFPSAAAAAAKSLQSCLTLCKPINGSPPGSAVPGILQARTLEWGATKLTLPQNWHKIAQLLKDFYVHLEQLCYVNLLLNFKFYEIYIQIK